MPTACHLPDETLLGLVRDSFLFSLYLAGIRFGDLAEMEWAHLEKAEDGERLIYRMGKVTKEKSLLIIPPAQAILDRYRHREGTHRYVFPFLDDAPESMTEKQRISQISQTNALSNKYLKKLAEQAKIKKHLTTHIARHSFADLARQKGWSIYDISKVLNHSSIAVTERYLESFDRPDLDEKHKKLF